VTERKRALAREREKERRRERENERTRDREYERECEREQKRERLKGYGVATMSRMLKNTGLFAEYRSLL